MKYRYQEEPLPPSPKDYGTTDEEALDAELSYLIEVGEVSCDLEGDYDSPMREVFREAEDELKAEELLDILREEEDEELRELDERIDREERNLESRIDSWITRSDCE